MKKPRRMHSEYQIKLQGLHPAQQAMLTESRRYNVASCGRRFGKTLLALDVLIDGPREKGALHGYPVALYAPTYQTMLESWRKLVQVLKPVTLKKSDSDHRLDLLTGGVIECWSLDNPDAGRGRKYATVVIDEAAMIKRLDEAWGQNILPLLLDYRGEAWIISTPKGDNYFKTLFDRGCAGAVDRDPEWQSWQLPTWDNPYITRDDIEKLRVTMTQLEFLQEIEAQFVTFAGTFVKADMIRKGEPPAGMTLYQGVDLALSMRETADYTAVVTVGVDDTGRVWIVDAVRQRGGFQDTLNLIKAQAEKWRPASIGIENVQYQAVVVEELLRTTALPVRGMHPDKDKLTRAQGLITRYENHLVWHALSLSPDYEREILSFGPDCEHDDLTDAAVYAFMQTSTYNQPAFIFTNKAAQYPPSAAGLPPRVVEWMTPVAGTCGACSEFNGGQCAARQVQVQASDPACDWFM